MKVVFSGTLLRFVDYQKEIDLDAPTVAAALSALVDKHPPVRPVLFDGQGRMRSMHRLFLNTEQLWAEDLSREVQCSDCLEIVTAIAGG
jgi:molybdopterin synthase sulfur carrier subunit